MNSEELCRYEVLNIAAYGGRGREWFLGEFPSPDEHRREATKFLLEDGCLKSVDPVKATAFCITNKGRDLLADLTEKFNILQKNGI